MAKRTARLVLVKFPTLMLTGVTEPEMIELLVDDIVVFRGKAPPECALEPPIGMQPWVGKTLTFRLVGKRGKKKTG